MTRDQPRSAPDPGGPGESIASLPATFHERALAAIGQAVVATDLEGAVVFWNPAAEALFGHSAADAHGRRLPDLVAPVDTDGAARTASRSTASGAAAAWPVRSKDDLYSVYCEMRRTTGSSFTAEVTSTPVTDEAGRTTATLHQIERALPATRRDALREALGQQTNDVSVVIGSHGWLQYVSPSVHGVFAYHAGDLVGRPAWDFVHPDDADLVRRTFAGLTSTPGSSESVLFRVIDGESQWRWFEAVLTNCLDDPDIAALVCSGRDVSERVAAEQALRASESRHRAIVDTAQEGIWAIDISGRTMYANNKLASILGVDLSDIYLRRPADVLSQDDEFVADKLRHRAERGAEMYEIAYQHPDGARRMLRLSASPLQDAGGPAGSLAMITDITAAYDAEEALRRQALHDDLTGLANRTLLTDRLEHALIRRKRVSGGPVAVLFANLDQFKLINDSWGHSAGDVLLTQVAERLAEAARVDDTVARFGGDAFAIVCEDTDEAQARQLSDDLLAALGRPFDIGGRRVHVSASFGVAVSPPESAQDLLRFADAAMYGAKARGRGQVEVFDVSLADEASQRLVMSNDLRESLERNQLTLNYQPLVNLRTGRLMGLEALARWTHARHGVVPPDRFVAVAETTGLAHELGAWALERATQELAQVRRIVGANIRVSVNISALHLADPEFEAMVLGAVTAHQVPRGGLLLEIAESALVDDTKQARKVLERLRIRGVEAAIDDFGTGYSSLGRLNTLPVSMLKIDRSFIESMTQSPDSLAIASSIVDLARTLKLSTVAEGVETVEQLTILRQLGCTGGQGFLWSPALPLAELGQLIGDLPGKRFDVAIGGADGRTRRAATTTDLVTVEHGLQHLMRMHFEGASTITIAAALNSEGYRTPRGVRWHRATVSRAIEDCANPRFWKPADDD